jgi:hypothetical protein
VDFAGHAVGDSPVALHKAPVLDDLRLVDALAGNAHRHLRCRITPC